MIYIGIDPGLSGALAVIHNVNDTENIISEPFSETSYLDILKYVSKKSDTKVCCLEHVSAMPKQGVVSTFNFGSNFGWIQGVLQAYCIPYELVRPQKWKKEFGITADKNTSIEVCQRLFPELDLRRSEKSKKPDDGIAEALLMAEYAKRRL